MDFLTLGNLKKGTYSFWGSGRFCTAGVYSSPEGEVELLARRYIVRISVFLVAIIALFVAGFVALVQFTPFDAAKLQETANPTVVYDTNGKPFLTLSAPGMSNLPYQDMPQNLINAVVATEDHTFWQGSSIDVKGIFRAAFVDLWTHSLAQGGSTIQEQLAKIVYLNDKKTITRKINQVVLGVQISRHFTKQEILAMYLNRVFLGENSIGVEQAAMRYFGVDLQHHGKLTLDQAALLAGLPQAPSAYDPLQHPKAALQRRNTVLQNMVKYGYITQQQADAAAKQPLGAKLHPLPGDAWDAHPLFTNFLFDYAAKQGITAEELLQGGLKVYTTVNPAVQKAIHTVFWNTNYNGDFPGPTTGTVVQGAAVFVDPKTGGIIGAAGSRKQGFARLGIDRVFSKSSPGSSIKPIMEYAPAIQSGKWGPTSILDNKPHNFGGGYAPQNWDPYAPPKVTLQYGLQWSQNVASVWLLQQIGIQTGADFAAHDGIQLTAKDREHLGIAIGGMTYGVSPMEMAQAYEPFDNNGVQMKAYLISKIVNQYGVTTYQHQLKTKTIMTSNTATVMTRLMQDVVDYGTGQAAQVPGWGVAGKTGTVQYNAGLTGPNGNWVKYGWFDGYTPSMVGSIYLGYDISSPQYHLTMYPHDPSGNAAQIFGDIVKLAVAGQSAQQFPVGPFPASQGTATAATNLQNPISGLTASYDASTNAVQLKWKSSLPGAVNFVISRATDSSSAPGSNAGNAPGAGQGSNSTSPGTNSGTNGSSGLNVIGQTGNTSYSDPTVQPGSTYTYIVQAQDANNNAPIGPAASVTITIPGTGAQPPGTGTAGSSNNTLGGAPPQNNTPGLGSTGNTTTPNNTSSGSGSSTGTTTGTNNTTSTTATSSGTGSGNPANK